MTSYNAKISHKLHKCYNETLVIYDSLCHMLLKKIFNKKNLLLENIREEQFKHKNILIFQKVNLYFCIYFVAVNW